MAKTHPEITPDLRAFIEAQQMFFVATAPLDGDSHVNMSPKGLDAFRVLSPHQVAYLDLTGSGNETAAHLIENGRITFMFCAFEGPPRILRLYGKGRLQLPGSPEWESLRSSYGDMPGARQIIVADITRVQTSCGFGVPLYRYTGQREVLVDWANAKGETSLQQYRQEKNAVSIDGLPALPTGEGQR